MSNILQRMVLRARDPAMRGGARIEPVLAVRHAPSALVERAQENIPAAPRSPVPSTAHAVPSIDTAVNATLAQTWPVSLATTRQATTSSDGHETTEPPLHRMPTQQLAAPTIQLAPHGTVAEEHPLADENSTPPRASVDTKTVFVPTIAPISTTPSRPENAPITERKVTPVAPPPARVDRTYSPEPPAANSVQATPEITISIGHIDLRSAPAPSTAKRTEFRPRVSLSEFLAREGRR
ncbi:hypothetical protein EO087_06070 [Dyella sp. M7H15-1]|uniref:hypothetical protein n=1 Tax=Dyella sp. M7H15-1 TaxID=2501295 RepID=UPI001005143E|nr:hypothetical protein [Dyella sp. M7H15-1]QAU23602.1 hypothetical protein EO087_06070 [Dyella sp. M7H15-1]